MGTNLKITVSFIFVFFAVKKTSLINIIADFTVQVLTPSIAWESLNNLEVGDSSLLSPYLENYAHYKKTENIKFFLDKGILHAEITQEGFIHDRKKDKMIPQNAKTYYRFSEEKKIFTKLN